MDNQPLPPNSAGSGERPVPASPEDLSKAVSEQVPSGETAPAPGATPPPQVAIPATVPPASLPVNDPVPLTGTVPAAGSTGVASTPAVADDVDVIEPEWVDKAEEVVRAHHGDPYGEEEAIEDLQQDYLKKRYGYNVADPNADGSKPEGS